jgi:hypothetical protein
MAESGRKRCPECKRVFTMQDVAQGVCSGCNSYFLETGDGPQPVVAKPVEKVEKR